MTTKITDVQQDNGSASPDLSALADQLAAAARTHGVELTGPGGLLTGLTKQALETALDVELSDHLGNGRGERSGIGNVRNGSSQTVLARSAHVDAAFRGTEASSAMRKVVECSLNYVVRF